MAEASALSKLEREKRVIVRKLNTLKTNIEGNINSTDLDVVFNLETWLDEYKTAKIQYEEIINKILDSQDRSTEAKEKAADVEEEKLLKELDVVLGLYGKLSGKIKAALRGVSEKRTRESLAGSVLEQSFREPNSNFQLKLERLAVPTFDGDYKNFIEFRDLYLNLIHNESNLSNVQKLHYLKKSLVGQAATMLNDVPLTEASYLPAWNKVNERYGNYCKIVMSYFQTLFSIEPIQNETSLQNMYETFDKCVRNLKATGESTDSWSSILAYMLYSKADERTKRDFKETVMNKTKFFSYNLIESFIVKRAATIEDILPNTRSENSEKSEKGKSKNETKPGTQTKKSFSTTERPKANKTSSCVACSEAHLLIDCSVFQKKTPSQRFELIKKNELCVNCFRPKHNAKDCRKPPACRTCKKRHHSMLHFPTDAESNFEPATPPTISTATVAANLATKKKTVLLPSAVVRFNQGYVYGAARLILDSCAQGSFVSDSFIRKYGLKTVKAETDTIVEGFGGGHVQSTHVCNLTLESRTEKFKVEVVLEVVPPESIRYHLSNIKFEKFQPALRKLELADTAFYQPVANVPAIDILIGAEYYEACLKNETMQIDTLNLRATKFGWTISGKVLSSGCTKTCHEIFCNLAVDEQISRFWQLETVEPGKRNDPDHCDAHFENTYKRLENGQFQVRLPLRKDVVLSNNKLQALAQFKRMEQKLLNSPIKGMYADFMTEYEHLNHMSISLDKSEDRYYIPHHAILRPASTTTKLRVVFNASAKTSSGNSLNDALLIGPVIQRDLFEILIKFRNYAVAWTADIEKMYRCIQVHPNDRKLQTIIWRENREETMKEFELNTVTYGTAPASLLATKCLQVLAREAKSTNRIVADLIENNFYMDDFLGGVEETKQAIVVRKVLHEVLEAAGFKLRKYQSSSAELLKTIPTKLIEHDLSTIQDKTFLSILGTFWVPLTDKLSLKTLKTFDADQPCTKRQILSQIARVFDPLGLASPVTIRGKLIMQRVWAEKKGWDEKVNDLIAEEFQSYLHDLCNLNYFEVPRRIYQQGGGLIGFCDASEKAYCAVVYLLEEFENNPKMNLICAKTKVAPLQKLSIPRLELSAALLLAELANRVSQTLSVSFKNVKLFSDSTVVLAWLAKPAHTWKPFVENRVQKIQSICSANQWSYVPTQENPADLATRGLSSESFLKSSLWLYGPKKLTSVADCSLADDPPEKRRKQNVIACNISTGDEGFVLLTNYSSYLKLVRVTAYVLKFYSLIAKECNRSEKKLSVQDIQRAKVKLIFLAQQSYFRVEYARLLDKKSVNKGSSLKFHNPFLDENRLIRLSTRLNSSNFSFDKCNPIVLHAKCNLTVIFIRYIHEKYFHASRIFLKSYISNSYHVVGGLTNIIKKVIRSCTTCCRYFSKTENQIMANLPAKRVTPSRPFSWIGIDFAGPFETKCVNHRTTKLFKAYAAVFICFSTRAIHLEAVPTLTTEDFLNAFHRFTARRGLPYAVHSDRGTNFVGASNYLNLSAESIQSYAIHEGITWHFNPPHSPHYGGIWEAAVKAMKKLLVAVTRGLPLTYEEFGTYLTRIESVLNSRPLCYRDGYSSWLTPSHFLIRSQPFVIPEPETSNVRLTARYREMQRRIDGFWTVWSKDYINQLRMRTKWLKASPNLEVGQVVLLRDMNTRPVDWPMGIVAKVFRDQNGNARTYEVRTKSLVKTVPRHSITVLPLNL